MREVLEREYGVPVRWVEDKSRNTHENAVLSAKLLQRDGISRVLVVCHGVDARRTRREFSATGLEVIPAPTNIPSMTIDNPIQLLPSMGALYGSYFALYELFGNVASSLHLNTCIAQLAEFATPVRPRPPAAPDDSGMQSGWR